MLVFYDVYTSMNESHVAPLPPPEPWEQASIDSRYTPEVELRLRVHVRWEKIYEYGVFPGPQDTSVAATENAFLLLKREEIGRQLRWL